MESLSSAGRDLLRLGHGRGRNRVSKIQRFPIKSMLGEELDEVWTDERGLRGDRAFAVVDVESGKVASAKHPRRWAGLLACRTLRQPLRASGSHPNFVVDVDEGATGFVENAWVGRVLQVGPSLAMKLLMPTLRCVMTTLAQEALPSDPELLRARSCARTWSPCRTAKATRASACIAASPATSPRGVAYSGATSASSVSASVCGFAHAFSTIPKWGIGGDRRAPKKLELLLSHEGIWRLGGGYDSP